MKALLLTLCLALAGCDVPEYSAARQPLREPMVLLLQPMRPGDCPNAAMACVRADTCNWEGRVCTLYLPEERWLECIAHEARHAVEGQWHGDTPTPCDEW